MGAFSIGITINVGHVSPPGAEARRWNQRVEVARKILQPATSTLAELADIYLRGDHPYTFLRDRLAPVFPALPDSSSRIVRVPLDHPHLGRWFRARKRRRPKVQYDRFDLGFASREKLTFLEQAKIAANFHLSQRGPGGYLHEWRPAPGSRRDRTMELFFERQQTLLSQVELGDLIPSILECGRLPAQAGEAFERGPRAKEAWELATAVWMVAQDADLAPWKEFCVGKARLKFPDGDEFFPEWVTGSLAGRQRSTESKSS